ncbi:hypothetical protein PYW08_009538 [Mythimna loreyi]|uniref:Uncharacterized protein n=1 Tax=Mythimna loreyi TaxID=667449 RepID=A0ACC2Q8W1_9NEOP|nr:hypothetical protein PYW08_009538 [Mythimna loreyi]
MKSFYCYSILLLSLDFIEGLYRCDYRYNPVTKGWFKHYVNPATWADARLRCQLEGATLASPTTDELKTELNHIINNFFTAESEIFTGIQAMFSQGDYYTLEGIPLSEIPVPWADNEPDNKNNQENCITFNGKGEMADLSCDDTRPYICYRAETNKTVLNECGTIDPGYVLDARTKSCYKFHTLARNFSRAFLTCTAEGGHLAVINSEVEAKVLKDVFAKYPAGKIVGKVWKDVAFIGFHNWGENAEWRTIHGDTLAEAGYDKFKSGEPNNSPPGEDCGAIYREGTLNDLWCDKPAPFICEKSPDFPLVCKEQEEEQDEKNSLNNRFEPEGRF